MSSLFLDDGVFVTNLSGFTTRPRALQAGFGWIAVILTHDPAAAGNEAEIRASGAVYRSEGWRLCGWGTYGQSAPPEEDAIEAARLVATLGLDGWIANGELWAEGVNRGYSRRFLAAWKATGASVPLAVSCLSSDTANFARDFDYQAWLDAGCAVMPQVYGNVDAGYTVDAALGMLARAGVPQSALNLTFGTYSEPVPYADYQGWSGPRSVYLGDRTLADAWGKLARSAARPGTPPTKEPPPVPPVPPLPFHRVLKVGTVGYDVWAAKRATYRLLKNEAKWQAFLSQPLATKRRFGTVFRADLTEAQHILTVGQVDGVFDQPTLRAFEPSFDVVARGLWLKQYPVAPTLCYPYPVGEGGSICQGLHPTAGLTGNWAIDFCDTPGARVLAVEAGTIQRLSGHPPDQDVWDTQGVFGFNTYLRTAQGYVYFVTHLGWQNPQLPVGHKVTVGEVLGKVGDQHYRPDHCHYGVMSPLGEADAKKRITQVSQAARISVQP